MRTPSRYLDNLWTTGTERLDTAFDYYEANEEIAASRACRDAVKQLQTARFLSRFVAPPDTYPLDEELQRARRLQAMLDSEPPASGAPIVRIEAYEEQMTVGDAALRDDDIDTARVAYLAAFVALVGLLPEDVTLPDEWPTESETDDSRASLTEGDTESSCVLCRVSPPTTTVDFLEDTVRVCAGCEATLSGRFDTTEAVYERCDGLVRDIRDTVETTRGLPWLSSLDTDRDDQRADDERASVDEDVPDVDAIWLIRDLAAVSQQVDHPATPEDVEAHGTYPPDAYRATFGSWPYALRQAGFDIADEDEL